MEPAFVSDSRVGPVSKGIPLICKQPGGRYTAKTAIPVLMVLTTSFTIASMSLFAAEKISSTPPLPEITARNSALENLRMKILALKLTPSLTVADFSYTNKDTRKAVSNWLGAIKKRGHVTVAENGAVTVTVAVSIKAIQMRLDDIYASYYDGKKIKPDDISNIAVINNRKEIRATGTSKPVEDNPTAPHPVPVEVTTTTPTVSPGIKTTHPTAASHRCWEQDLIPQQSERAKLMAELAAKENALYRLGKKMRSIKVGKVGTKTLTVNDFIMTSNYPDVDMSEFLRAAMQKDLTLRSDVLVCEIQMLAELRPAIAILKSWADENYRGNKSDIQLLRDYVEKHKPETITEIGTGVVEPKYVRQRFRNQQEQLVKFASKPPGWISEIVEVTGEAAVDDKNATTPAAAKTKAIKAAKADAEKKLNAKLLGLELPGGSTIKGVAEKSPDIIKQIEALKKNIRVSDDSQLEKDKTVRVTISIRLKPVWDIVLIHRSKNIKLP